MVSRGQPCFDCEEEIVPGGGYSKDKVPLGLQKKQRTVDGLRLDGKRRVGKEVSEVGSPLEKVRQVRNMNDIAQP